LFYRARRRFPKLRLWACVYDREALSFCRELGFDGYKIHASEIGNLELITSVAGTGKPVHLCVGGATSDEILVVTEQLKAQAAGSVTLLHGIQSFPTQVADTRVRYLETLAAAFGLPVGFQDHSGGDQEEAFWLPAAAVGAGASVLEKHLTDDRLRRGADFEAALDPIRFSRFVQMVRQLEKALQPAPFQALTPAEQKYRILGRRVWLTRRPLEKGQLVEASDLVLLKTPEPGLQGSEIAQVLGKRCRRALTAHAVIQGPDVQ